MGSEWPEVALTDIYDISSGLSKPAKDFGSGYPFLAFKDVFYNVFVPDELTQLVQSSEKEQTACSIRRGDVFLTRTSETMNELGMSAVALKNYDKATFNGFTKRLRPKNNNLHPEYAAYYLRSPKFRTEMMAFSTMSTRASLNNEMIGHLKITIPPIAVQKTLAWILKTLDDKIDLNRKMNTTLETMAQALFKSWFVDFDPVIDNALAAGNPIPEPLHARAEARKALGDQRKPLPAAIQQQFPDRFVFTEEMGWVPEGWKVNEIKDILHRLKVNKRYKKKNVEPFGDIPVFEQGAKILLGYHCNKPEVSATQEKPAFVFGDHTCVTKLSTEPFSISENVIALQGKGFNTYWVYYAVRGKQSFEEYRRHWMELTVKTVVTPSKELANCYADFVSKLALKQSSLSRQTTELTQLRDTLLPKLLSGELRVPEVETTVASALAAKATADFAG